MKFILLGSPGAGKGTVAKLLSASYGSVHISTGDILRNEVKKGTSLGIKAKDHMDKGDLVPDSLILDMMEQRLQESDCSLGFILDGFPRTVSQAEELDKILHNLKINIDLIVNIHIPEDIILDRLTTRRTCSNPKCQEIYNIKNNPTKVEGICDKCGSPTIQRSDETKEVILNRLNTYYEQTAPLIKYYKDKGVLKSTKSINSKDVNNEINNLLAEG